MSTTKVVKQRTQTHNGNPNKKWKLMKAWIIILAILAPLGIVFGALGVTGILNINKK